MKVLVGDVEAVVQWLDNGKVDGSPYNPNNQLVSAGWVPIINGEIQEPCYEFFYHTLMKCNPQQAKERFQAALDWADLFVAHNAKYDYQWLVESGFRLPDKIYCTQVGEYIFARGRKDIGLSLEESAIRHNLPRKKSDLTKGYWKNKIGYEAMPPEIVQEYGIGDIMSCAHLYIHQQARLKEEENSSLGPTFDMSMEFMVELANTERNGIAIDMNALDEVENGYREEKEKLTLRLAEIASEVMGDTPINFSSPAQLSQVVYSRKITNKELWVSTFNIGKNDRGKDLPRPRMSQSQFSSAVRKTTAVVRRTVAEQCTSCQGKGYFYKEKKDGSLFARPTKCSTCTGSGIIYTDTPRVAGLKLAPNGVDDIKADGFATDADSLELLIEQAKADKNDVAVEFLSSMIRLNAVDSYISMFCMGIRNAVCSDGILHPNFNQTVTSTGRLSSSQP